MELILLIIIIVLWKRVNRLKRQIDPPPEPLPKEPVSVDQLIALAMVVVAVGVIWMAGYLGY